MRDKENNIIINDKMGAIIKALRNNGRMLTSEIEDECNITRSTIRWCIKQLKTMGYKIESKSGHKNQAGYLLIEDSLSDEDRKTLENKLPKKLYLKTLSLIDRVV